MKTLPPITKYIIEQLKKWCNTEPTNLDSTDTRIYGDKLSSAIDSALQSQNALGWDKFLRGFISKDWGTAQELWYSTEQYDKRYFNRDRWTLHLQRGIHEFWFQLWDLRNKHIHGGTQQKDKKRRRHRLRARVRALYQQPRHILPVHERKIFRVPLMIQLKRGNEQLSLWIKRCEMTFAFYKEKDIEKRNTQRPITDFIPTWNTLESNYYSASDDSTDDEGPRPHYSRQLTISNWLKSNSVRRGVVQGSSSNGRASLS